MIRPFALVVFVLATLVASSATSADPWRELPPLPDREGFAGSFAGESGGALLVAGGANFPDKKPWEGGTKVWYDTVYVLTAPDQRWKVAGKLPRPLGYGVSVTHRGTVVCVGGSDAERHYAEAFRLAWKDDRLVTTPLPSLPEPVANGCGALVGDTLYVAGGQRSPDATTTLRDVWSLDLSADAPEWKPAPPLPGRGRMLATAAACNGQLWVMGGVDLERGASGNPQRHYLKDAYRLTKENHWERVADLPFPLAASPSPAPCFEGSVTILGGDDGAQVGVSPQRHRGFSTQTLRYEERTDAWVESAKLPFARVTVPCIRWNGGWVIASGEQRPGIRSPQVWQLSIEDKD